MAGGMTLGKEFDGERLEDYVVFAKLMRKNLISLGMNLWSFLSRNWQKKNQRLYPSNIFIDDILYGPTEWYFL